MPKITKQRRINLIQRHIERLTKRLAWLEVRGLLLVRLRVATVIITVMAALILNDRVGAQLGWAVAVVGIIIFALLWRWHNQIKGSIARFHTLNRLTKQHVARATLDWEALPLPLAIPPSERSELEVDLDLVGSRSLHRLLDNCVSEGGSRRLRTLLNVQVLDWKALKTRQKLVQELAPRHALRNKLTVDARLAAKKEARWSPEMIQAWLQGTPADKTPNLRTRLILLIVLGIAALISLLLMRDSLASGVFGLVYGVYVIVYVLQLRVVGSVFAEAAALRDALEQLMAVFGTLEQYGYAKADGLRALCAPFIEDRSRPSQHLSSAITIINATGIRGNPLVWIAFNAFFPWDLYFAYRWGKVKASLADHLPGWLDVWYEVEAFSALSNFAWLHPNYTLPVAPNASTSSATGDGFLHAEALGHPLIADEAKVGNDFSAETVGSLNLITGSNMAGKSTFLRTLGVNWMLAAAGTVVDARTFTIRSSRIFTCIRINDSVADGFSYFYAEVQRLRALIDALEQPDAPPLLYFIDEIFRGTNNRERLIGGRALVRAVAGGNGVGFISTHDLDLVKLSDEIDEIANFHFREDVIDGKMVFDYRLRQGPCPTTNAVRIMRLAGLPVPPADEEADG